MSNDAVSKCIEIQMIKAGLLKSVAITYKTGRVSTGYRS